MSICVGADTAEAGPSCNADGHDFDAMARNMTEESNCSSFDEG